MLKPGDEAAGRIVVVSPMTTSTPCCSNNGTKILLGGGIITMPDSGTPERFMQNNELPAFLSIGKIVLQPNMLWTNGGKCNILIDYGNMNWPVID